MAKKFRQKLTETKGYIKEHKMTFAVYLILRTIVIAAMVLSCIRGNYENLFVCTLSLILFMVPSFISNNFGIVLPNMLEIIILLFIFAANILGEMQSYYLKIPYWDTMLHTINGFISAAIGFGMVDILNTNQPNDKFNLSPLFLSIVAFCFSMTVGTLWEFFEYASDFLLKTDMQKDTIINCISSTKLNLQNINKAIVIDNITQTAVNGEVLPIDGYLDIGLTDTMKDLFVNFIGAVVFSVIGYFYVKSRGKNKFADLFIPRAKRQ